MFITVLAIFLIAANCAADDNAVSDQVEDLITEEILHELSDTTQEDDEVSAAIRYMIPIPQPQPVQDEHEHERDPIVAVSLGPAPGRWGRRWKPIGPPVIAVPIGSASLYQSPAMEDNDHERRTPEDARRARAAAAVRRARSIPEEELKADERDQGELTSDMSQKEEPAKGFHGSDNPLKVSSKMGPKGSKSGKMFRPKRQVGGYYVRGGNVRPNRVIVTAPSRGQVVVSPNTQVVPVPVYVPVSVDSGIQNVPVMI